ncbi:MAG: MerR family transcriptional regulator [Thermoleophilaceae bacterium]|nr:MerR family transcriptional regulator [Thermoleophilaceae bacterium]
MGVDAESTRGRRSAGDGRLTPREVADEIGVAPQTLRRWARDGVIPGVSDGESWPPAAVAHARMVARLRARGHSLERIKQASREGRLAFGFIEDLFPTPRRRRSLKEAAEETGLEPELIGRLWGSIGLPRPETDDDRELTDEDIEALRHVAAALEAGFPLTALLQLTRVYGHAVSQMADAEVRLFHLYVHEPLMREGVPGLEMAEEMEHLARDLLPQSSPLMDFIHRRFLRHFLEQDVIGHMEMDLEDVSELGRVRVVIAFCDLAGYTRFTEEEGEEEALSYVERFIDSVIHTLPDDARVVKTIGDEVMIVGHDVQALVDWAVGFQRLFSDRPAARIGMHYGATIYRDGDYFGREINVAARVVARARGGEVLITDAVHELVKGQEHLGFEDIGDVKLKGFDEPRRLSRVVQVG